MRTDTLSRLVIIFACIIAQSVNAAVANVFPKENAVLNYRIIGFSFPVVAHATGYKIEVADGSVSEVSGFKPIISSGIFSSAHTLLEVSSFGHQYTWRIVYFKGKNKPVTSPLYHFTVDAVPQVDTANYRLRVTQQKDNEEFYVITGGTSIMYDAKGKPVWYLRLPAGATSLASDIKYTAQHTLTYLLGGDAVEADYNGKVLWSKSSVDVGGNGSGAAAGIIFHHEFSRLASGHYMCLASEQPPSTNSQRGNSNDTQRNHHFFPKCATGDLYEVDSSGNIVWAWKSEDYFRQSDLGEFYDDMAKARPDMPPLPGHENAFYFDEPNKVIYLSYVTFNRIIRISYPSGKVLDVYGPVYTRSAVNDSLLHLENMPIIELLSNYLFRNDLFSGQHACRLDADGSMIIYNNNMHRQEPPEVIVCTTDGPNTLKREYAFQCPVDNFSSLPANEGGGNVCRLSDGSIFASMNSPYAKLFIVNSNGALQWCAVPEKRQENGHWIELESYRSTILSRADLESLIWHSEGIDITTQPLDKAESEKRHRVLSTY